MARDVEKNVFLYFYDPESGIFTGEVGTAGDSDDFTLPPGMTTIAPPTFETNQRAVFDIDLQTWSINYIDPYDGLSQVEKDAWDAAQAKQQAIDAAQDAVTAKLAQAVDAIFKVLVREGATLNLSTVEIDWATDFHNDYLAWKALEE